VFPGDENFRRLRIDETQVMSVWGSWGRKICTYPDPRSESGVVVSGSPPLRDPILVEKVISGWTSRGACKGSTAIDRSGGSWPRRLPLAGLCIPENRSDDAKSRKSLVDTDHAWVLVRTSGHIKNVSGGDRSEERNGTGSRTVAVYFFFGTPWISQP